MKYLRSLVLLMMLGCGFSALVQANQAVQEGVDYTRLTKPIAALEKNKNKIEVVEFFAYLCNHCRDLDLVITPHVKTFAADTAFRQIHVDWDAPGREPMYANMAKLFSAVNQLHLENQLNENIYTALFDNKVQLWKKDVLESWIAKQPDIDAKKFMSVYDSFATDSDAKQMKELTDLYGIDSTPRIIVAGKYEVSFAKGFSHAMAVVDVLIQQERQQRGLSDPKPPKTLSPSLLLAP